MAVPSPRQPSPGKDKYYRGGYITQNHGSSNGGVVDAIQLELPVDLINSTEYRYSKQIVNFLDEDNISHQHESTLFQDKNGSFCWRCDC